MSCSLQFFNEIGQSSLFLFFLVIDHECPDEITQFRITLSFKFSNHDLKRLSHFLHPNSAKGNQQICSQLDLSYRSLLVNCLVCHVRSRHQVSLLSPSPPLESNVTKSRMPCLKTFFLSRFTLYFCIQKRVKRVFIKRHKV